jgi:hypothetical protein
MRGEARQVVAPVSVEGFLRARDPGGLEVPTCQEDRRPRDDVLPNPLSIAQSAEAFNLLGLERVAECREQQVAGHTDCTQSFRDHVEPINVAVNEESSAPALAERKRYPALTPEFERKEVDLCLDLVRAHEHIRLPEGGLVGASSSQASVSSTASSASVHRACHRQRG